ncbi:MAG: hypothetical protein AB1478_11230 [Nitrospirota bacterium]
MTLEAIQKKKESLEVELAKLKEQEKAEIEKKLRGSAQTLLKELTTLGYTSWSWDSDNSYIKVGKKRAVSKSNSGHEITVTTPTGETHTFKSGVEACKHFGLSFEGNSTLRVLKSKGYAVQRK